MTLKSALLSFIVVLAFITGGYAQQKNLPAATLVKGPPSASALKTAEEMMISSGGSKQFDAAVEASVTQMSTQVPEEKRAAFVIAMKAFMAKYYSWAVLKDDICMMYAREFTEPELKQLAAFYKSPVGIKLLQKSPLITQTGMLLGQKAVAEHTDEFDKMMLELAK